MPQIDYILNGIPLRGDGQAISIASGANPFAPRSGGGTTYRDFSIWSVWEATNWQAGGMKTNPADGGYLYAEAETRLPGRITLPPKKYEALVPALTATDSDYAHFAETQSSTWMGYGKKLYRWDEPNKVWSAQATYAYAITDIAEFAGRIFVAFGDTTELVSIDPDTLVEVVESPRADLIVPFGGLLYISSLNTVSYTNYEVTITWEGPLRIAGDNITGMAGVMNGALVEQIMYISTGTSLYALLAGDVVLEVSKWPGNNANNGRGMIAHMGDVYVPVGRSMMRITSSGDLIPMGPDLGAGLPRERDGYNVCCVSTLTFMYSMVSPQDIGSNEAPSVWAWSGEGWHQVISGYGNKKGRGLFYSRLYSYMFMVHEDGSCLRVYIPDDSTAMRRGDNMRYETIGFLDTGHYFGDLREVDKLWGDVAVHGCFPTGTSIQVYYTTLPDMVMCGANWSSSDETWTLLGTVSATGEKLVFPTSGKQIRLKFVLLTTNDAATPMITAVVLEYIPRVVQQWAFQLSIKLPVECLTYRDGSYVPGYVQSVWDAAVRQACMSVVPVSFTDIDGKEYSVAVTAFSRRVANIGCADDDSLEGDIFWSLSLLQLTGNISGE